MAKERQRARRSDYVPPPLCGCGCGNRVAKRPSRYLRGHWKFRRTWRRPIEDRFAEKVEKSDGCWEWRGCRLGNGYGTIGVYADGKWNTRYAHRISWEIHRGPIPPGMFVCHRCDNPPCVNPDHLFLGSVKDNAQDMIAKGRGYARYAGVTHCIHGHEFTPKNTHIGRDGGRNCRACGRRRTAESARRRRAGTSRGPTDRQSA